jgi:hypothetical protein
VTDARGRTTTGSFKVTIANTQPSTLTITSKPIQVQGKTVVSARLLGPGGTPIVGRTVTFTAGTATATGITNASGVATATLAAKPGLYTLTATFAGDAAYTASTAKSPLLVLPKSNDEGEGGGDKGDKNNDKNTTDKSKGDGKEKDRSPEGRD